MSIRIIVTYGQRDEIATDRLTKAASVTVKGTIKIFLRISYTKKSVQNSPKKCWKRIRWFRKISHTSDSDLSPLDLALFSKVPQAEETSSEMTFSILLKESRPRIVAGMLLLE